MCPSIYLPVTLSVCLFICLSIARTGSLNRGTYLSSLLCCRSMFTYKNSIYNDSRYM